MNSEKKKALVAVIVGVFVLFAFIAFGPSSAVAADEIRIGFMAPMKGPLAKPGEDLLNGFKLFWKQNGLKAGGRPVKILYADSACNPDQAITQARRLIHAEKVNMIIG
ncbi:MAG: ABC transporter substrate-binding protein, partial [Deltaproteobacteria bacterium]|nr:ABC transporter substrate-binding protein [Deltaproteobacteria bacterium]